MALSYEKNICSLTDTKPRLDLLDVLSTSSKRHHLSRRYKATTGRWTEQQSLVDLCVQVFHRDKSNSKPWVGSSGGWSARSTCGGWWSSPNSCSCFILAVLMATCAEGKIREKKMQTSQCCCKNRARDNIFLLFIYNILFIYIFYNIIYYHFFIYLVCLLPRLLFKTKVRLN